MAIRSGIGIGAAQIADTSNIMNAYGRQIAQQQKAQALQAEREAKSAEKYNEELADLMASVKTEGARDIDVPDITNAYNQIKEYYSQSSKLKDSDKPLFRAELKNKINGLNEFAQRSNKFSKDLFAMSSEIAKNEWDYEPASVAELNKMSQTTLKQLGANAVIDPMRFKRLPNFGLIDTIIDKTYDLGKENAKFVGEVREKDKRRNLSRVDPAVIQNNLIQQFTSSPEATKAITSSYVRELGKQPTDQDLTNYIMDKYKTKHGFDYLGEIKDLQRPRGGGSETESSFSQPIELNIPFAEGKGFVNVKDYVKLPLPNQNFAGSTYIDMATGQPSTASLESSNDYEVVGVGNFPIIVKGNMKGSISQPRFAEQNPNSIKLTPMVHVQRKIGTGTIENLLVPYDRLPPSAKTKKGLANFTPAGSGTKSEPTKAFNVNDFLKEKGITK